MERPRFRIAHLAIAGASLVLAGCSGMSDMSIGGRPMIYKQGPADPPSTIEERGGVVAKRAPDEPAVAASPRVASSVPADRSSYFRSPSASPAARTELAQAAAPSPRAASNAVAATELFNGYTQATRYGDLVFISGQISIDPRSGAFEAGSTIQQQTRQALENIRIVLESNRLTMANVVSTTVYLSKISAFGPMDEVYHEFFKGTPPARTVVEVSSLPRGALVEISAIAGR
jgi:2-iminobutanoate/2-iminopropanoate deaminase